jgi:flagellar motor switch protein FliN
MNVPFEGYLNTWLQNIAAVLEQLAGEKLTAELSGADPAGFFKSLDSRGVWLRFVLGKRLKGQQAFLISEADGARLARMLMGEPSSPSANDTLTPDYRDALEEVFRQFAGPTASALKTAEGEASITWEGEGRPTWVVVHQVLVRISASSGPPVMVGVAMDALLRSVLSPDTQADPVFGAAGPSGELAPSGASAAAGDSQANPASRQAVAAAAGSGSRGSDGSGSLAQTMLSGPAGRNLDLLMEVPLQVTLRFGERQLLLRDVLELSPGSVVELDRQVKEPAELLVTGRIVARGEVVIVDGNYGLRITEVAPPSARAEILR